MSAIDANLEWPRFCYSSTKEAQDVPKQLKNNNSSNNKAAGKKASPKNVKNIEKGDSSNKHDEHLTVRSDLVSANVGVNVGVNPSEKFAFSRLMRQMAEKYQDKNETEAERQPDQSFPFGHQTEAPSPAPAPPTLPPHFPIDPLILRAAFGPFFPFHLPSQANFFPTFSSSQALIALASKKRTNSDETTPDGMQSPTSLKRERFEDPLDLSSSQPSNKRIKEESEQIETGLTTESDPENWSVDRVVAFVENIETCQEYAEVFRNHSIDGSALLQLTENHMTKILGLKLGHAIKLRLSIRDLVIKMSSQSAATTSGASTTTNTAST